MTFIQIIEARTENLDGILALDDDWAEATEGKRTARRSIVTTDRNDPTRHLVIVFFDDYESAMKNSALPETQTFAERWAKLVDEPPAFRDLDVIADRS
jgi:quinol monooxygenase YgiN